MNIHSEIQNKFYDYCVGEISSSDRALIEEHVAACSRCSGELNELKESIRVIQRDRQQPSSARPEEYWRQFSVRIDEKIRDLSLKKKARSFSIWDRIQSYVMFHPGTVTAVATACIVIACAVILWKVVLPDQRRDEFAHMTNEAKPSVERVVPVVSTNERLGNYFRKSKILLVGISNMKTESGQPVDLSFERQASRSLIKEARFLQSQQIDGRSARLIEDLNKILVELANMEEQHDVPGVEIIRGGIHQENLLFKIRMAEARYDSSSYKANNTF